MGTQNGNRLSAVVPRNSTTPSINSREQRRERIAEWVTATAMAMGALLPGPALRLFVDDLELLSDEEIQLGLTRCRREIGGNGYAPTLTIKDVLDRAGVVAQDKVDNAECRAAWDALLLYGNKHIVADPEGCYGPRHYFGMKTETPELEQRISDVLRRIGGWRVIKTMKGDDYRTFNGDSMKNIVPGRQQRRP